MVYAAFVIYGSLVPFDFRPLPFEQAWAVFKQTPFLQLGVESRADWIANGVLYVPLGFLGARAFSTASYRLAGVVVSLLVAVLLAFVIEFAQVHFPPRTVSQNDLLAEAIGGSIGSVAAFWLESWLKRFHFAWIGNRSVWTRLAWQVYALAFLLYSFFPYDLLISYQEFQGKLTGENWGWLFALPSDTTGMRILLVWLTEIVTILPLGFVLGLGHAHRFAIQRGLVIGTLLGLIIEIGQLTIASGVSQGASVVSRAAGMALGAAIGVTWQKDSLNSVRIWLNRHFRFLLLLYLVALALTSWSTHPWRDWDHAQQSWESLRLLPFYYHYFTTEAKALASLTSIVGTYLPFGVLAWARMARTTGTVLITAMLALVIESGKLFMNGTHPDPTNILIAGASVWLLQHALAFWESGGRQSSRQPTQKAIARRTEERPQPEHPEAKLPLKWHVDRRDLWLPLFILLILWNAANWPAFPWLVVSVIGASAALTWWQPAAILVLLPAAMPVFDLAPWSGRFYVDEFDLLCATSFAVWWAREKPVIHWPNLRTPSSLILLFLGGTLLIGAAKGLGGAWPLDMNSFSNYHSAFNGIRILKGALWAGLFIFTYRSHVETKPALARLFHFGIASGLLLTVSVVLLERMATVSLFDFVTEYRVTGPFSTMNKGGAYIECFLAVSAAFVIAELVTSRNRVITGTAAILLALTTYAIFVTYSRNGYAALGVGLGIGFLIVGRQLRQHHHYVKPVLLLLGLIAIGSLLILSGGYASERLAATTKDFSIRQSHWDAALGLRDDRVSTSLFGVGLGRFPEMHFWHSHGEPRAATYRLEPGNGNAFLRLGSGAPLYIEQIISPPAGKDLSLTLNLRSATAQPPVIAATLCRKTLLTADECESTEVKGIKAAGIWQTQYAAFPPLPEPRNAFAWLIPTKLSLTTPAGGVAIDVDNVSLRPTGTDHYLTRNGSFERGLDHWFFATDIDPPWHIHNLPIALFFDLGWLGLVAALAATSLAVAGAWRSFKEYRIPGMAAFAALAAFFTSGTLNTLIDEPRFLWLWLILLWLCAWHGRKLSLRSGPV